MTRRSRALSRIGRNTPLRISLLPFLLFTHLSITPTRSVIYLEEIDGAVKYDSLAEPPPTSIGNGWSEEDLFGYRLGTPDHYLRERGEVSIGSSGGTGATTDIDDGGSSNNTAPVSSPYNVTSPVEFGDGSITEPDQNSTGNIGKDSANMTSPSEAIENGGGATEDAAESESGAVSEIDETDNDNSSIGASFFDFFDKEDFFAGVNRDQDVESQKNETISIFERSLENQDTSSPSPPTASPSVSRPPTRYPSILPEITGAYTDHYPPHSAQHSHSQTYFELFNYFDDLKLLAGEGLRSENLVFFDSKQAGFGSDFGPRGNAAFVNIMLPPRWTFGYSDLGVEGDKVGNSTDAEAVRRILQGEETLEKHNSTHLFTTDDTIEKLEANACTGVCLDILSSQFCPPELERKVMPNCLDAHLGELCEGGGECGTTNTLDNCLDSDIYYKRACNETLAAELRPSGPSKIEDNMTKFNETVDSAVKATFLENGTLSSDNDIAGGPPAFVNEMDDSFQFDTSIADYFCLEDFIQWRRDQKAEPKASVQLSPLTPYLIPNPNSIESSRSIAIMAKRGRCSFESKARMAMVFNDLFLKSGRDSHIDAIIVYNNGTRVDNNSSERLIEMNRIRRHESDGVGNDDIRVGLLYIATPSGLDLLERIRQRYVHTGSNPYLDVPMLAARRLRVDEAIIDDGERDIIGGTFDETYHDPRVTHGWFFPATLSKFCVECGPQTGYGFLTSNRADQKEGDDIAPVMPPYGGYGYSRDDYFAQPWLEVVRRVMIAILVVLLLGPLVLATKRWYTVGGTVRISTDERGRRHLRLISPSIEVFVNGAPDSIESNGTKLDRAQVYALPEIEYAGSDEENVDGGQDQGDELSSPLPTQISTPASPESGTSGRYVSSSSCSICLEDFEVGEKVRLLPRCQHFYHTDCVLPWLTERQGKSIVLSRNTCRLPFTIEPVPRLLSNVQDAGFARGPSEVGPTSSTKKKTSTT